jgi:MFS family permease
MFGAISGLAAILGMVLGGVLTSWNLFGLGWRTIFLINIPIGIFGIVVGLRNMQESKAPKGVRLDLIGVVLACAGLLLLLFPLVQGRELGWPTWVWVSMVAAIGVLAFFVSHERRTAEMGGSPLLPISLFGVRSFSSGIVIHLLFNFGMGIFFMSWTLYMQLGLGWSPWEAGLCGIPFCLGAAPGAAVSVAVLAPKYGRKVIQAGAVVMAVGLGSYMWAVLAAGGSMNFWYQALPLLIFGIGFGMNAGPLPDIVLTEVPGKDAGAASGLYNTNQQLGAAVGIALASVVYFGMLGSQSTSAVQDVTPTLRQDLVAAGAPSDRADGIVASFGQCAAQTGIEPTTCDKPAEPALASAVASAEHEAKARTFGGTFPIALPTIIGYILLTLAATRFLPGRVVIRDPEADGTVAA